ncbi:MAG: four helix bundle protein [Endomicrobium sp.]|jgi:four helix bundle protein|nr:four helix bundle protein [Endomicrobium sp.]
MVDNILYEKSKLFAIRIVKLQKYLCDKKKEFILSKQILRSGTSIGANIAEAEYSVSRKEFLSKLYIALKECAETQYWLELLFDTGYITKKEFTNIEDDCIELLKILKAITKTVKNKEDNY